MATQLADTLTTREAVRRAALDDLIARAEVAATAIEGGALDGIQVVSLRTLRDLQAEALVDELPPPSERYAEVITPATVTVSTVCPECRETTGIVVKLGPRLTVEGGTTELAVKAKSKAVTHMHGQLSLPEVEGQETLEEAIEDLRLRILGAVNQVGIAWERDIDAPAPTLDAIASVLQLATDNDRFDLEESLYAYSQAEPPLIDIVKAKHQTRFVVTPAGIDLIVAGQVDAVDEGPEDEPEAESR